LLLQVYGEVPPTAAIGEDRVAFVGLWLRLPYTLSADRPSGVARQCDLCGAVIPGALQVTKGKPSLASCRGPVPGFDAPAGVPCASALRVLVSLQGATVWRANAARHSAGPGREPLPAASTAAAAAATAFFRRATSGGRRSVQPVLSSFFFNGACVEAYPRRAILVFPTAQAVARRLRPATAIAHVVPKFHRNGKRR
jgi:hypothetical protein